MPDSGTMSSSASSQQHHPQQPPFYSPPAPPPPSSSHHHHLHLHQHPPPEAEGGGYHLGYNGDNNGNVNGGGYNRNSSSRQVSFSPANSNANTNANRNANNPNDANNNQGLMLMEEDGGGGHHPPNGGDMFIMNHQNVHQNQRDLFEDLRNGGGHWSQLLRQVVLTPPPQQQPGGSSGDAADSSSPKCEKGGGEGGELEGSSESNTTSQQNGTDMGQQESTENPDNLCSNTGSHVVPLQIVGGSENGQFVYVGITTQDINRWITVGYLQPGDIILEIQGQQVILTSLNFFLSHNLFSAIKLAAFITLFGRPRTYFFKSFYHTRKYFLKTIKAPIMLSTLSPVVQLSQPLECEQLAEAETALLAIPDSSCRAIRVVIQRL